MTNWKGPLCRDEVFHQAWRKLCCLEVWNLPTPTFLLTQEVPSREGFPDSNPESHRVAGRWMLGSHTEAHNKLWLTYIKTDLLSHLGNLGVSTFFISVLEHPKSLAGTLPWASSHSLSTGPKLNSSLTSSLLPQTVAFGLRFPLTHESIWELNMSLGLRYPQSIWELNMSVGPSLDQYYLPSLLLAMPPEFCHLLLVHRPLAPLFICHLDHLLILPISTLALLQFIFHGS